MYMRYLYKAQIHNYTFHVTCLHDWDYQGNDEYFVDFIAINNKNYYSSITNNNTILRLLGIENKEDSGDWHFTRYSKYDNISPRDKACGRFMEIISILDDPEWTDIISNALDDDQLAGEWENFGEDLDGKFSSTLCAPAKGILYIQKPLL